MSIEEVFISVIPGDRRAAAFAAGELVRLVLTGPGTPPRRGDVFQGLVGKRSAAMGAAFVELGHGRPGVLMDADAAGGRAPPEGASVRVEVIREADDGKGPKLSQRFSDGAIASLAGTERLPCRLRAAPDPITALLRTAAGPALRRVVVDDPATMARLRAAVPHAAGRLEAWLGPVPLFESVGVDAALDVLLAPDVPLPGGGRLRIEETAALVAIDVDTAAADGGSPRTTAVGCNLEAAAMIGERVRSRELSGRIVIDFVPLRRPAERDRVTTALRQGLEGDDRLVRFGGWTSLGLVELLRERRGPSLARRVAGACRHCGAGGTHRAAWLVARDALRAALVDPRRPRVLRAPADVLDVLRGPLAEALKRVGERLGRPLALEVNPDPPRRGYTLEE